MEINRNGLNVNFSQKIKGNLQHQSTGLIVAIIMTLLLKHPTNVLRAVSRNT